MVVAVLSPVADWTLFWVVFIAFMLLCFALGTVHIMRDGHISLLGGGVSWEEGLVLLLVFLAVMLVAAPFYLLWVLIRWVIQRFSPEARRQHEEAVRLRRKERNPRLEQDRLERRLAASKARAAKRSSEP